MLKYILKRLMISVIILLGVSIIIYTLVRMMPNDYVDTKWASQTSTNTVSQEDIDNFKKLYGLYMPEAHIKLEANGTEGTFSRDVKTSANENVEQAASDGDVMQNHGLVLEIVVGTYSNSANGNLYLTLSTVTEDDQVVERNWRLYETVSKQNDNGETIETEVVKGSGTFDATYENGNYSIILDGLTVASCKYAVASFGEKLGSILSGYFTWLGNMLKGDLGRSFLYEKPVAQVIGESMWMSFAIAVIATILQFLIAIPLGIVSATKQYSVADYTVTIFTMIGLSLPTYFFARIIIKVLSVDLGWFPPSGLIDNNASYTEDFAGFIQKLGDMSYHLILPIFCSVILSLGGLMRYTRTNTLEVLNADYIRTARAKGLSEKTVIYKHAFRNTLIPLATLLAGILPSLFGGMMITEQVFSIDGIGNLAYKAVISGDVPFVMGYNMFLAVLTVIGTLFSDIMYSIVDPRVKLTK